MNKRTEADWEERQLFYTLVGQTISFWSSMETTIAKIFAILMDTTDPKAGLVLYSTNFNVWLHILSALFISDPAYQEFEGRWNKMADRLRGMNDKRVRLAHHTAFESRDSQRSMLLPSSMDTRPKSKSYKPMDAEEINSFGDQVVSMSRDLQDLHLEMLKKRHVLASLAEASLLAGGQRPLDIQPHPNPKES